MRAERPSSQRGTARRSTPPPILPRPVMTRTHLLPSARAPRINRASARCASSCVIPCKSSRASTGCLPRFSRSAFARSMPANRSSARGGWGAAGADGEWGTATPSGRLTGAGVVTGAGLGVSGLIVASPDARARHPTHVSPASIRITCRRRGPCAPSSMRCSISPVREGPVMKFTVRGKPVGPRALRSRNKSQPSS